MQKITPFLWFDKEAMKVAEFYASVFKDSKIKNVSTLHDTPSGTVEIVTIELFGQDFTLMSAGPLFNKRYRRIEFEKRACAHCHKRLAGKFKRYDIAIT